MTDNFLTGLDQKVSTANLVKTYDPVTNRTTFTLPYRAASPLSVYVRSAGGESIDNEAPEVDAGVDVEATEGDSVVMAATVTDDGQPLIAELTYLWEQVSGPSTATISDATILNPTITDLEEGEYVFKLTASDREFSVSDTVTFTVAADGPDFSAVSVNGTVECLTLDGDTLYIGGHFTSVTDSSGTYSRGGGAALDLTTGLFGAWNPDIAGGSPTSYIKAIKKVGSNFYIGGSFYTVGGTVRRKIAKVDSTGAVVSAFEPDPTVAFGPSDYVASIESDGTYIYLGGSFTHFSPPATTRAYLSRVDPTTGALDTWNPDPNAAVEHLYINGSTIYASGNFTSGGSARNRFAAWSTVTGTLDATFDTNYAGGNILDFAPYSSTLVFAGSAAGLLAVGSVDASTGVLTAWDGAATNNSQAAAVAVDGTDVYVGGTFTSIGGQSRNRAGRLSATTALADSWNPNANNTVWSIAVNNDYAILGGQFTQINGVSKSYLAIVDKSTGLLV